jgi:isochorismate synthase
LNNSISNTELIKKALKCGIPFAVWSLPQSHEVNSVFCKPEDIIKTYATKNIDKQDGFVFAPFQICKHLPVYIIPFGKKYPDDIFKLSKKNILQADKNKFTFDINISKKEHINQVNKFLSIFKNTGIKKAVLSRNKWLSEYNIEHIPALFDALNKTYPNAFVYQVYIPEAGYWAGATPELLFSADNGTATTVSLAGTQPYNNIENVLWNEKEIVEQELVTEHIRNVLHGFNIADYSEDGPKTAKAGQMIHLKTVIKFNSSKIKNRFGEFIEKLHPTPAICGLPVKESLELILETEGYDREYYTGYLGTVKNSEVSLFVNLRCLQAFDNGIALYAGGGITPDSNPEKEWEETKLKIQTLESLLKTIQQ